MIRISKTFWGAAGVGAATLVYLVEAWKLPFGAPTSPGIGFMPVLGGLSVLGLCLILMARDLFRPGNRERSEIDRFDEDEKGESAGLKRPALLGAALLLYPVGFGSLGFILTTFFLLLISLRLMEYRGWAASVIMALVIALVSYGIFYYFLDVRFPKGMLF